jgi:arylsulfatase A-like enzyme
MGSLSLGLLLTRRGRAAPAERPNILWITVEDMSPTLGCYGDDYAHTPNLDRLAAESVRYDRAYATAPVCSPARSCLITGLYATTMGTQRLRSRFPIPGFVKGWPSIFREAGYFTSNRTKTDYNTSDAGRLIRESWTVQGPKGHWRRRKPGQPFFCVFNHMVSHQSRSMVWPYEKFQKQVQSQLAPEERHDPAKAPLPPYYPDTPVVRRTVARYYDCVTAMDKQVGELLGQLEEDGLAEDTIVVFYSDHGSGMPRHKRLVLDSGLRVALIVRFPKKYAHLAPAEPGEGTDRLVSFVDFPPTTLQVAGLPVPKYMQGKPFLGPKPAQPRQYIHGARDRVDEAYDVARCVRDGRFLYVRNYMPHLSYNQPSYYSDLGEIRDEITALAASGELNETQMAYAGPTRPAEELYDGEADPHQIHNLAGSPEHKDVLDRMRGELRRWVLDSKDLGFLPEWEAWHRSEGTTPYEMARETHRYPIERILDTAELVGRGTEHRSTLVGNLKEDDAAVRYWAVMGLRALGRDATSAKAALRKALDDASPPVRIEAAGALAELGEAEAALPVLVEELREGHPVSKVRAARTLELMGQAARPALPAMKEALAAARKGKDDQAMFVRFALDPAVKALSGR